jgi:O-antigen/teichoic acid export membrane protein
MGKIKRLISNTAILGAGTFISKVLVFLLMPLYTACLSSEQFGVADILMQTANLIIPVAVLGISEGLLRFTIDANSEERKQVFTLSLLTLFVGMLPLAALIQIFRLFSVYDGYVWLVFFYICSANLHLLVANYVRGCDKTKVFAIQGIINTSLVIIFNVTFLVVFDMGVMGYVLSVVLADFWYRLD